MSLTLLHCIMVFKLVYSENWGKIIERKFCNRGPRLFPCVIQDQMKFPFLYQYDDRYPSFYQMNVLNDKFNADVDEADFFYQKVRDIEVKAKQATGATIDHWNEEEPTSDWERIADEALTMNTIWRRINRRTLKYELVRPMFNPFKNLNDIHHKLWSKVETIPAGAVKKWFFTHWDEVSPKTYLEHDFTKVLQWQLSQGFTGFPAGKTLVDLINWIQSSVSRFMNVDFVATEFTTYQPTAEHPNMIPMRTVLPLPNIQPLVEKQRAFSRDLITKEPTKTRIIAAVRNVLQKIWSYVNAIEGIVIDGIRGVVIPKQEDGVTDVTMVERRKNVVLYFDTYAKKREKDHIELVIPGQIVGDYDTIEAVVNDGNFREMLTLINGYGYIPNGRGLCLKKYYRGYCDSCLALWDVIFAYTDKAERASTAKHKWDPFYLQWFNKEDIKRRKRVLQKIAPIVFEDRIKIKDAFQTTNGWKYCTQVRWQKYGEEAETILQQNKMFSKIWGEAKMQLRKGSLEQQSRFPKVKDIEPPLSVREKAFIREQAIETKNFYQAKLYTQGVDEFDATNLDDEESTMFLPWFTGFCKMQPNYRMPFYYQALHLDRLSVAGPSKSSDLMMDIAVSFGLNSEELFFYELGVISWMGMTPSHSIIEVLLGFPYHSAGIHKEYKITMDPYEFINTKLESIVPVRAAEARIDASNYESMDDYESMGDNNNEIGVANTIGYYNNRYEFIRNKLKTIIPPEIPRLPRHYGKKRKKVKEAREEYEALLAEFYYEEEIENAREEMMNSERLLNIEMRKLARLTNRN